MNAKARDLVGPKHRHLLHPQPMLVAIDEALDERKVALYCEEPTQKRCTGHLHRPSLRPCWFLHLKVLSYTSCKISLLNHIACAIHIYIYIYIYIYLRSTGLLAQITSLRNHIPNFPSVRQVTIDPPITTVVIITRRPPRRYAGPHEANPGGPSHGAPAGAVPQHAPQSSPCTDKEGTNKVRPTPYSLWFILCLSPCFLYFL